MVLSLATGGWLLAVGLKDLSEPPSSRTRSMATGSVLLVVVGEVQIVEEVEVEGVSDSLRP